MASKSDALTPAAVAAMATRHEWAATGVSDYPPRDPLVGQSRFFKRYRTFIHTVDTAADSFAHVFALEGEWGRGKSRIGYELIAQINDCSKGWFVRDQAGMLTDQKLFDQAGQDRYLALYIRYSQVASDYQNSDNWFGFGLYKALLPLATKRFDGSIQSKVAEQALRRLEPMGFDPAQLAAALEVAKAHSDELLYEDPALVVTLVQAAYAYLQIFGIGYVLVVLDELETVAEAATYGLEQDDTKRLDGQAIRLIGKAIKEEDPRRRLPWLRYVALCSPLLGQQLREIQSVARRVELVELEHSAFADVSDYVRQLKESGRLGFDYPVGLVEAAYAMSGANFGWFNVVMANVDAVIAQYKAANKPVPEIGVLFDALVESSSRVARHVLDAKAIEGIKTADHALRATAKSLLYGQLPVPLDKCPPRARELLEIQNEDGEPVASLYRKVPFDALRCRQALEDAKFTRKQDEWVYAAVDQPLSLDGLLNNLRTFAINEPDAGVLLLPLARAEFKHLLTLLYDHPAIEFAADALWQKLVGGEIQLPPGEATHIGPSVAMLLRLDLRYRNQQQNSMIFRDPACASAHEVSMKRFLQDAGANPALRFQVRLTGLFRLLDRNWGYEQAPYPNTQGLSIQLSPRRAGVAQGGGLMFCDALKLHPDGLAWFAWVNNRQDLDKLHALAAARRADDGRMPVVAFTASAHMMEQYTRGDVTDALRDDVLMYYLNPSEVDQVERVGLLADYQKGFEFADAALTTRFKNKLNALRDFGYQAMHQWRKRLNSRGLIAWPIRSAGKLTPAERDMLFAAWRLFVVNQPQLASLHDLKPEHQLNAEDVAALLQKLAPPTKTLAQGYTLDEHAGLFSELANPQLAAAHIPQFLATIGSPAVSQQWTLERAKRDWYWGYLWQQGAATPKAVFDDWMWWCDKLHLLQLETSSASQAKWVSFPRAAFEGAIDAAKTWFAGNATDGYCATVATLERVFGYDRIPGLFAPLDKSPMGTETVVANEQLVAARARFDKLKTDEEALVGKSLDDVTAALPVLLQGRSEVLSKVSCVRPIGAGPVDLNNINTLRLEDKAQSLYQRIEQARLFADFVEKSGKTVSQRVQSLIASIDAECGELKHFPKSLFTLSLQTIPNILDGALAQQNSSATAKTEGTASSDTLLHFLRSLQLDKAAERLALLAEEAGVDLKAGSQQPFAEVAGNIMATYRLAKMRFEDIAENLAGLEARGQSAKRLLDPLPPDYPLPGHPATAEAVLQKLILVVDAFETVAENATLERERFRGQSMKGQFSAIRDVPERLFKPIQTQLNVLGGDLLQIENAVQAYQSAKVAELNELRPALEPLYAAAGATAPVHVAVDQIATLSLHDLGMDLAARRHQWEQGAATVLEGSGMTVTEWIPLAKAILAGGNPSIDGATQDALVKKGVLKVKLAFGAGA